MYTNISIKLIIEHFDLFWAMRRLDKGLSKADWTDQDVSFVISTDTPSTRARF